MNINQIDSFIERNGLKPKISVVHLNPMVRDMFQGEYYIPGETVAKCLTLLGWSELYLQSATSKWDGVELSQDDITQFITGFVYINLNIQRGYLTSHAGLDKYREMLAVDKPSPPLDVNDDYLVLAFGLLSNDPWGIDFADIIIQTEAERQHNPYFQVGLEVGYRTYKKYVEILKLMNIFELSKLNDRLDILKLRKILSTDTRQQETKASTAVHQRKHAVQREFSEAIITELDSMLEKAIAELALTQEEIQKPEIQWRAWEKLLSIPNLKQYFAFYTFAHLSAGDFLESAYNASTNKSFIQKAKEMYSTPLDLYSFWANDPGTRYACAYKLLSLLIEHFHELNITTHTCSALIYKMSLDAIRTNERMYVNCTYDDSRAIIQGRVDDLTGILMEHVEKHSPMNPQLAKEALTVVENNKSKLLNLEISLLDIKTPRGPGKLYEKERACLEKLRSIRVKQHNFFEPKDYKSGLDELTEFAVKRLELEEIWSELESFSEETQNYVAFRRDGISYALNNERLRSLPHLGADTGIISFYAVQDRVYSLLAIPHMDVAFTNSIDLPSEKFWRYVQSYKNEIVQRNDLSGEHDWQSLGDVLFSKIKKQMSQVKRLCLIPHRELHQLPLHALKIRGKSLIEEWEIFYSPSLKVLNTASVRTGSQSHNLVMSYVPLRSDDAFRSSIDDEINTVARILNTNPITGDKANRNSIGKHSNAKVIHIASHGYFDEQYPLYSGVRLSDGILTAKEWLNLSISTDLVTLSACQTGLSSVNPGDELVGLARSILFAGASSLLTTLWEVEGNSTRSWMVDFYKNAYNPHGKRKVEKASAFRETTLEMKREYKNPYYWAPFVLLGNPK